jgi:hypothetical protein
VRQQPSKQELLTRYLREKQTIKEIAEAVETYPADIQGKLREHKIVSRGRGRPTAWFKQKQNHWDGSVYCLEYEAQFDTETQEVGIAPNVLTDCGIVGDACLGEWKGNDLYLYQEAPDEHAVRIPISWDAPNTYLNISSQFVDGPEADPDQWHLADIYYLAGGKQLVISFDCLVQWEELKKITGEAVAPGRVENRDNSTELMA